MARKRMIDPSLWTDPKILKLSTKTMVVFVGMISHADDEGIIEIDPTSLYFRVARSDISIDEMPGIVDEIVAADLIKRYGKDGQFGFIPTWFKHQNLKGRSAQFTKLSRPPKSIIEQFPNYVNEWEITFSKKDDSVTYPFSTCYAEGKNPSESTSNADCHSNETPVTQDCASDVQSMTPKLSEVKGSEVNRISKNSGEFENSPPLSDDDLPPEKSREEKPKSETREVARTGTTQANLKTKIRKAFLSKNNGTFTDEAKESRAINQLVKKAYARDTNDPVRFMGAMINKLWELKSSGDKFWKSQPFLPSTLNASGIFDRVLETFREPEKGRGRTEEELQEYERRALI